MCRFDSDAKLSDDESDGGVEVQEEAPKAKKRKKETSKAATPAKRSKREVTIKYGLIVVNLIVVA